MHAFEGALICHASLLRAWKCSRITVKLEDSFGSYALLLGRRR